MNKNLVDNNYLIIPNFISSYRANKLKEEFVSFSEENFLSEDDQSPNSKCFYNYISFLEILCEKTPKVSDILEETVLPTYSYSRVYKNGSTLEPHVDRDACEISLTLHLGGDSSCPIYIKTPSGKDQRIVLNPGDAMIYLGCEDTHWMEKYNGEQYVQVFLHYVRSRGDKFYAYFDKATTNNGENLSIEEHNTVTDKQLSSDESLNLNNSGMHLLNLKPYNKLEDFVEVFDDIMSDEVCNLILDEYSQCSEWHRAKISNNVVNSDVRNFNMISISEDSVISNNFSLRKQIDNFVYESISFAKNKYMEKYKSLNVSEDTAYSLMRYEEKQFYIQHTDQFYANSTDCRNVSNRVISCSIQLNDDYDGGEFAFFDREMLIRSKKGSIIMFPSNFMYPHEIMPVIKGTRYSIVTWLL